MNWLKRITYQGRHRAGWFELSTSQASMLTASYRAAAEWTATQPGPVSAPAAPVEFRITSWRRPSSKDLVQAT